MRDRERHGISKELKQALLSEIREKLTFDREFMDSAAAVCYGAPPMEEEYAELDLQEEVESTDRSFQQLFFDLAGNRHLSDRTLYQRAQVDRRLFSKLRSNPQYHPNRRTALRLAIALELPLDETQELIGRAGYTLTRASRQDIIIAYFIEHGKYDIDELNDALFEFDQELI